MRRFLIHIFLALPLTAYTQTVLTLDNCVQLAKDNNKRIEASQQQFLASRYEQRSAKALFLPSFSLVGNALYTNADGSYSSGSGNLPVLGADGVPTGQTAFFPGINLAYDLGWMYNGGVKMELPIYMGGKIRAGYRMTKIGNEIARQSQRLTESDIVVETSRAYAGVVQTKELMRVAESYYNLLTELIRAMESAHKHGLKSQNDLLKIRVKQDEAEMKLHRAENGHRLAMMNLCHYIGFPLTETVEISYDLPEMGAVYQRDADLYSRPEYQILDKKVEMAKQKVNMTKGENRPQVGLMGQYGYVNGIELNGRKMLDNWNLLAGIQVSIPIFDFGHRSNKIRSAKAQQRQIQAEREEANERLALEMAQSFNNLDEAFFERKLAESSVESAEENLRTSRLLYEKGMETLSDYLEAQALWQQARQTQVESRVNCYLRWLEYQKATGKIN